MICRTWLPRNTIKKSRRNITKIPQSPSHFRRPLCFAVIVGMSACASARAQDAQAVIKKAEYALEMLRGPQRIDAVNTLEYWGTGVTFAFGPANHPGSDGPAVNVSYHASLSYAVPAMRIDMTRSNPEGAPQAGGGSPAAASQRQIDVVSGKFAWNESVPGAGFMPGTTATPVPQAARDRMLQLWSLPFGALKMAAKAGPAAKVSNEGGSTILTFPLSPPLDGITMSVTLNSKSQVERVETRAKDGTVTETTYSGYKEMSDITTDIPFPSHIVRKQGGSPVLDLTVTRTDTNNPYVVFPVPDNVESSGAGR
jgi:hypothetical protein